jgi:hypothetical protein
MRNATREVMDYHLTDPPHVVDALRQVAGDLKLIASDEMELGRNVLARHLNTIVAKASIAILGAIVALIGLAMLCAAAVVALAPVIHPLGLRLFIMAIVYIAVGAGATAVLARRFGHTAGDLDKPVHELEETVDAVTKGLAH